MPMRTGISSLGRIFSRNRLSLPSIARLLAFGFATTLSFAPLAAEGQERPQPKQSAPDVIALASDPSLWDKMAPFQSVDPASSSCSPPCKSEGGLCTICIATYGGGCVGTTCDDGNSCTDDACDAKSNNCVHDPVPTGTSCPTGNVCTSGTCSSKGTCVISPLPDGTSCPTGNVCTSGTCSNGTCVGRPLTGTSCPTGNVCTSGTCSSSGTCVITLLPNGTI